MMAWLYQCIRLYQCIQLAVPVKDMGLIELDISIVEQWFDWITQEDIIVLPSWQNCSHANSRDYSKDTGEQLTFPMLTPCANQKPFSSREQHSQKKNETIIMFGCKNMRIHGWFAQHQ